jgi:hypothetical protein
MLPMDAVAILIAIVFTAMLLLIIKGVDKI